MSRHSLWQYLLRVRAEDGTTIFLTTHYLEEAEDADRVCVIDHGRIAIIGTPDEMKARLLERSIEVDATDRSGLAGELRRLGLEPVVRDDGGLRVAYDGPTAHSIIARILTPLTQLRIHDPSLEEAYVELLRSTERPRRRGAGRMTATSLSTPIARPGIASRFAREVNATRDRLAGDPAGRQEPARSRSRSSSR